MARNRKNADCRYDNEHRRLYRGETVRGNGYEYKYYDVFRRRRSLYAKTLKELREKEKNVDRYRANGRQTLDQVMQDCFRLVACKEVSAKTLTGYIKTYDRYIRPVFGKKNITAIKPIDIKSFYLALHKDKGLKVSTIATVHAVLHRILDFAKDAELVASNPADDKMHDGYSIYLVIQEHQLSSYYDFLQLVLNQTFFELEQRPENAQPVLFIIDELPRILSAGRIERLLDGAKTLRSRKVTLYLIIQSVEALTSAYSESQAMDLISNCPYILVLDATSTRTQKLIIELAGRYISRKRNWNHAASKTSISTSFEEKNLIDAGDIMLLRKRQQAMLVSPYGFYFIDKNPYFKDPVLSKLSAECVTCNESINS